MHSHSQTLLLQDHTPVQKNQKMNNKNSTCNLLALLLPIFFLTLAFAVHRNKIVQENQAELLPERTSNNQNQSIIVQSLETKNEKKTDIEELLRATSSESNDGDGLLGAADSTLKATTRRSVLDATQSTVTAAIITTREPVRVNPLNIR